MSKPIFLLFSRCYHHFKTKNVAEHLILPSPPIPPLPNQPGGVRVGETPLPGQPGAPPRSTPTIPPPPTPAPDPNSNPQKANNGRPQQTGQASRQNVAQGRGAEQNADAPRTNSVADRVQNLAVENGQNQGAPIGDAGKGLPMSNIKQANQGAAPIQKFGPAQPYQGLPQKGQMPVANPQQNIAPKNLNVVPMQNKAMEREFFPQGKPLGVTSIGSSWRQRSGKGALSTKPPQRPARSASAEDTSRNKGSGRTRGFFPNGYPQGQRRSLDDDRSVDGRMESMRKQRPNIRDKQLSAGGVAGLAQSALSGLEGQGAQGQGGVPMLPAGSSANSPNLQNQLANPGDKGQSQFEMGPDQSAGSAAPGQERPRDEAGNLGQEPGSTGRPSTKQVP